MCLGVPVRIKKVEGKTAIAVASGVERKIGIELTPDVKVGEYVLLHAGFAIEKISAEDANETLKLLNDMFKEIENEV